MQSQHFTLTYGSLNHRLVMKSVLFLWLIGQIWYSRALDGNWSVLNGGVSGGNIQVLKFRPNSTELWAVGGFQQPKAVGALDVSSSIPWQPRGTLTAQQNIAFHPVSNQAYVVGFQNQVLIWNGGSWVVLGGLTFNDTIHVVGFHPQTKHLYIAGTFVLPFAYTAVYEGTAWQGLTGHSMGSMVSDFAFHPVNGKVYFCGAFTDRVVEYNGSTFTPVPGSSLINAPCYKIVIDPISFDIYIGGPFTFPVSGCSVNSHQKQGRCILKHNGTNWIPLGGGTPSTTVGMAFHPVTNFLYAGGQIIGTGGPSAVGFWNGTAYAYISCYCNLPADGREFLVACRLIGCIL